MCSANCSHSQLGNRPRGGPGKVVAASPKCQRNGEFISGRSANRSDSAQFVGSQPLQSSRREKVNVPRGSTVPSTKNGSVSSLCISSGLPVGSFGEV